MHLILISLEQSFSTIWLTIVVKYPSILIIITTRQLMDSRLEFTTYGFELFVMDISVSTQYEPHSCFVGLVSDQFTEVFSRKARVVGGLAELQSTLIPKTTLHLTRRLNEHTSCLAKLQVYIASNLDPNSYTVIGSLTFDLSEELRNPVNKDISSHFASSGVRLRLSISSFALHETQSNMPSSVSILKEIQNMEESTDQENKDQVYQDIVRQNALLKQKLNNIVQKQQEELNFSEIIPMDNQSKINESFDYGKHRELYQEVVRVNQQVLKVKEENQNLMGELQDLKQINIQLDEINLRLSEDLRECDSKIIRMERQILVYRQRLQEVESVRLESQNNVEQNKKDFQQIGRRNTEMMRFISELQESELKLNHVIADKAFRIEELEYQLAKRNSIKADFPIVGQFNKLMDQWKKDNIVEKCHLRELQNLNSTLRTKIQASENVNEHFHNNVVQSLRKVASEITTLKRLHLFEPEVSIINLISRKIDSVLNGV